MYTCNTTKKSLSFHKKKIFTFSSFTQFSNIINYTDSKVSLNFYKKLLKNKRIFSFPQELQ